MPTLTSYFGVLLVALTITLVLFISPFASGPKEVGGWVGWGPKGVGSVSVFGPKRVGVQVLPRLDPRGLGPSVFGPKRGWGLGPCPDPRGLVFGSFKVRRHRGLGGAGRVGIQRGWLMGPCLKPIELGVWVCGLTQGHWGWGYVRTLGGMRLGRGRTQGGWGLGPCPDPSDLGQDT